MKVGPFEAAGWRFSIEVSDRALAEHYRRVLDDLSATDGGAVPHVISLEEDAEAERFVLLLDGEVIHRTAHPGLAASHVLWRMNREAISNAGATHVGVHASSAVRNGAAVVLPADQESGKSTLVAALLAAGWEYVTDEAAMFRLSDGLLVPYPKPVFLDQGSWDVHRRFEPSVDEGMERWLGNQWHLPSSAFGSRPASEPVRVAAVVAPRYDAEATTALEELAPADGVVELATNSFNLLDHLERGLDVFAEVCDGAMCGRLTVNGLDEAVSLLTDVVDRRRVPVT
jgi:hypothetical protein